MKLHVLYRISASENYKARPTFYSKRVALASFLESLARVEVVGDVGFLCDGPVPEDLVAKMGTRGAIVELPGLGNSGSYRRALAMLREQPRWSDDDLVYFAEDDYLYRPEALAEMIAAAHEIAAASFFTPYDHPDYRSSLAHRRFGRLHRKEQWSIGSTRWRSVRSTTMTFSAHAWDRCARQQGSTNSEPADPARVTSRLGRPFRARHRGSSWAARLAVRTRSTPLPCSVRCPDASSAAIS